MTLFRCNALECVSTNNQECKKKTSNNEPLLFPYSILVNKCTGSNCYDIKGTLSSLRKFFATESPLKMMKNAFYFTSKSLFVLKIFKFLS